MKLGIIALARTSFIRWGTYNFRYTECIQYSFFSPCEVALLYASTVYAHALNLSSTAHLQMIVVIE